MTNGYYWTWGNQYNDMTNGMVYPCDVDEARLIDQAEEPYCAVLRLPGGMPRAAVMISRRGNFGRTDFFDGHRREPYLQYTFNGDLPDMQADLFHQLTWARTWNRKGDLTHGARFKFWTDRRVTASETDVRKQTKTSSEGELTPERLTHHWEPFPTFGDFASILREERSKPVDHQAKDSVTRLLVPIETTGPDPRD